MDEVGQMVRLRDALLWFTGAQWRGVMLPSRGSRKFVQRQVALLHSDKQPQMKKFDCRFWSKGNLGCC